MSNWTKADIDGLVTSASFILGRRSCDNQARSAFYLAAGLTAEGEAKPERVRCWMSHDELGRPGYLYLSRPRCPESYTPGTFVPDGAE